MSSAAEPQASHPSDPDQPSTSAEKPEDSEDKSESSSKFSFECNICFEIANDAVVSMCGHLFCWPCIHQWMETRPNNKICPVCKSSIKTETLIPIYGRNTGNADPRLKVPPRPRGQRSEPSNRGEGAFGTDFFGRQGVHISFGIGAFPFGLFTAGGTWGNQNQDTMNPQEHQQETTLSNFFLYLSIACIFYLLFL